MIIMPFTPGRDCLRLIQSHLRKLEISADPVLAEQQNEGYQVFSGNAAGIFLGCHLYYKIVSLIKLVIFAPTNFFSRFNERVKFRWQLKSD